MYKYVMSLLCEAGSLERERRVRKYIPYNTAGVYQLRYFTYFSISESASNLERSSFTGKPPRALPSQHFSTCAPFARHIQEKPSKHHTDKARDESRWKIGA